MKTSYFVILMAIGVFSITLMVNSAYAQLSCPDCGPADPRIGAPPQESEPDPRYEPKSITKHFSDAIITVKMEGDSVFYLDSPNQIIRAIVKIQNYTASDGQYFVKITHMSSQKVLKDFVVNPRSFGEDLWTAKLSYPIQESDIKIGDQTFFGEYQIKVTAELAWQTGSTSFFIFDSKTIDVSSKNIIPDWIKNNAKWWVSGLIDDETFVQGIQFLIKEEIIQIPPTVQGTNSGGPEIPDWVKNNANWWAQGLITETDFLKGIEYLVKNNIINVHEKIII